MFAVGTAVEDVNNERLWKTTIRGDDSSTGETEERRKSEILKTVLNTVNIYIYIDIFNTNSKMSRMYKTIKYSV